MVNVSPVPRQFRGLQGLRFIAAASVVLHHSLFYTHERLDPSVGVWGIGAVQLFFAISGFVAVVATRRFRERRDGWKYFLVRRGIRILPMYWLATTVKLVTLIIAPAAVLHAALDPQSVILSYFVLPSVNVDGDIAPLLGVAWTLLYETFFIAIFTLSLVIRWRPILVTGAILSACALGSLLRPDDYGPFLVYFSPILLYYVLGLVIGTFAKSRNVLLLGVGLAWVYGLHFILQPHRTDVLVRITVIIALMLVVVLAERWLEKVLPRRVVELGDASYSLYLFHPLIAPIVPAAFAIIGLRIGWLSVTGSVVLAVVCSVIIYRYLERPVTQWAQRRIPFGHLSSSPATSDGPPSPRPESHAR